MSIFTATSKALKFPVKLLIGWRRKKSKKTELEQKQWKYVKNFAPTHYSWQKQASKKTKKSNKKNKKIVNK